MTYIKFKPALFLSFSVLALLPACTTSLASRTPVDIASNSVRHTDPISGISEVLAPRVNAFSSRGSAISGSAQLRTAGAFTDREGQVFEGGSYLDILINYTTPTPAPQEVRGYDRANWAGGQEALLAEYGAAVLDCRQNIRENYTPTYRSYGYGSSSWRYNGSQHYYDRDRDRTHNYGYDNDRHDDHDATNHNQTVPPRVITPTRTLPDRYTPTSGERDLSLEPVGGNNVRMGGSNTRNTRRGGIKPSPVRPQPIRPQPTAEPRIIRAEPRITPKVTPPPPPPKPAVKSRPRREIFKPTKGKELNYYPGEPYYEGGYRDVTVSYRCAREESLRVFVPRERLEDAEYRGLVLYLRPQVGREEALFLPPNYVAGFMLAAYSPQGEQFTIQGAPADLGGQDKPETPADKPIIYGQP